MIITKKNEIECALNKPFVQNATHFESYKKYENQYDLDMQFVQTFRQY